MFHSSLIVFDRQKWRCKESNLGPQVCYTHSTTELHPQNYKSDKNFTHVRPWFDARFDGRAMVFGFFLERGRAGPQIAEREGGWVKKGPNRRGSGHSGIRRMGKRRNGAFPPPSSKPPGGC